MKKLLLLLLSTAQLLNLSSALATTPIKDLKVTGTSQISGGTFSIQTGVTMQFLAGSTLDVSLGTLTLADNQIPWAKVNKTAAGLLSWSSVPASSSSTGTPGSVAYDSDYLYIAVATNNWKRVAFDGSAFGVTTTTYTYASDGDSNGVFYGIGTEYGTVSWTNPHTSGVLTISASNLTSGTLASAVDRAASDAFDDPLTGNWWKVDLGADKALRITAYSYQQRSSSGNFMTGWDLQWSDDNSAWTTVDSVTGAATGSSVWVTRTVTGETLFHRYWRLLRTANDSSGNTYFTIGEWELYGELQHP